MSSVTNGQTSAEVPIRAIPQAFLRDIHHLTGQERHLLTEKTVIGRRSIDDDKVSCLRIDWCTISRRHAVIEYKNNQFWLTDQNSRNGTFVNGQLVKGKVCLRNGDHIHFHDVEFRFYQEETLTTAQPVTTKDPPTRHKDDTFSNGSSRGKKFSPARGLIPYPAI